MRFRAFVLALSIPPLLIACGGGSGSNPPAAGDTTVRTGQFSGLNISGLHYQTATQSGLTTADGEFQYIDGEQLSFSLGGIELGSVSAQPEIDLITELAGTLPSTREDVLAELAALNDVTAFDEVINIATLLMTLDADKNSRNGIDLSNLHSRMSTVTLDFSVPMSRFLDNLTFRQVVAQYGKRIDLPYKEVILAVYDALNLQIAAPRINRIREVISDGRVKTSHLNYGPSISRSACQHTQDGQLCSVDEDTDGTPSTIEQSILVTRDSDGHIIREDVLQGASSQTAPTYLERNIFIYTADAAKRLSQWQLEENGVAQSRIEHTYNSFGQPLTQRGYDLVGEESLFYSHTSRYSTSNLNEIFRSITVDMVNEEDPPRELTYSYDDQTNALLEINVEPLPSELVDQRHAYTYTSANGLDHTINFYLDNNASADLEHMYGYDALGHLSTFEGTSQADGTTIRQRITETYNALGQLEQSIHDVFGDGTPDWQVDYTYTDEHLIESKTVRRLQAGEEPETTSVTTLTYSLDKNPLADGLLQILSPEFGFAATPLIENCIIDNNYAELPECEPHP